ncbi:MAG TPA: hypothetical protein VGC62_05410 [Pseudomonas sp.]|uniref:RHS repeat domain-containing protein n=1 Tax=Pseudomonas sp. TaxID=306 RepID=UPI002ED99966
MASAITGAPSHAYNFSSFFTSGVDPRTGTFSSSISLCSLIANVLAGPSCPVSLVFNALQGVDHGFGIGWSIPCSRYSSSSRRLSLLTGASYEALISADDFQVIDKKIRDIKTSKVGDELVIEHKSGLMEVLSNPGGDWPEWLVTKIYSAQGRMIRLNYTVHHGRQCLHEVWDEHQRLLLIELDVASAPKITVWPDLPENMLRFQLRVKNGELRSIILNTGTTDTAQWAFTYTKIENLLLMSELRLPTGGLERVTYRASLMQLPDGAPLSALPAVVGHMVFPGAGQPSIVRKFSYSLKNYLGFGSNIRWGAGEDNLYQALGDFEYSSVEALVTGNGSNQRPVRQITRTYNRFHLLVRETTSQQGHVVKKSIEYNDRAGLAYHLQPANFQLPRRSWTEYSLTADPDKVRIEETLTEFDGHGNLLKQVLPTGVIEELEYYPVEGSVGCPADPFGGVRWLKSKTVTPAPGRASAQPLVTTYQYVDLPSATPARARFIALQQQSHATLTGEDSDTPYKTVAYEYVDDIGSLFFGRVSQTIDTINGVEGRYQHNYEVLNGQFKTQTTFTSMGVQSQQWLLQDPCFGARIKTEDRCGVSVDFAYDRLGRKVSEILAVGTPNQCTVIHEHHLSASAADSQMIVTSDSVGRAVTTLIDGLGRTVEVRAQDVDGEPNGTEKAPAQDVDHRVKPVRTIYTAKYNHLGQLVREESTDWTQDAPRPLVTAYEYDDWGNKAVTIGPDGVRFHDRTDPITLTHETGKEGAGKTVTTKNLFGKDDSIVRYDRQGRVVSTKSYEYDGYGRCVKESDPYGYQTHYTYDFANRVLTVALPDGAQIRKEYVLHSLEDLPSRIWANDYLVGERTYDGLLRMTSVVVGGRQEAFTYEGAQTRPATHTKASGLVTRWQYDCSLNNQPLSREVDGNAQLACSYRYDARHGNLIHAATPSRMQRKHYSASGMLEQEDTINDSVEVNASHSFSLRGKRVSYVDGGGVAQMTHYDKHARVVALEQGDIDARLTYDDQGRVSRTVALTKQTGQQIATTLEYDDFDREVRRLLTVGDNPAEELVQHFDPSDRLQRRTLARDGQTMLDESYSYDPRGRLVGYQCSGVALPKDTNGKSIVSQVYEFDALDNITRLTTTFDGGENIASYAYERADKTQLSAVTHSHPDYVHQNITFDYDADGNQMNDESGRRLNYDALGRLSSVTEVRP